MAHRYILATISSFVLLLAAAGSAPGTAFDGVSPTVIEGPGGTPIAGSTVTYAVGLSGQALGTESYSVTVTQGAFSSVPTTLYATSGSNVIYFSATFSSTFSGSATVTVSGNGGSAYCISSVAPREVAVR